MLKCFEPDPLRFRRRFLCSHSTQFIDMETCFQLNNVPRCRSQTQLNVNGVSNLPRIFRGKMFLVGLLSFHGEEEFRTNGGFTILGVCAAFDVLLRPTYSVRAAIKWQQRGVGAGVTRFRRGVSAT